MYIVGAKQGRVSFLTKQTSPSLKHSLLRETSSVFSGIHGSILALEPSQPKPKCDTWTRQRLDGVNDLNDPFPLTPRNLPIAMTMAMETTQTGTNPMPSPTNQPNGQMPTGTVMETTSPVKTRTLSKQPRSHSDADGDGYGDNSNGQFGDVFPEESSQWFDTDRDGMVTIRMDSSPTVAQPSTPFPASTDTAALTVTLMDIPTR